MARLCKLWSDVLCVALVAVSSTCHAQDQQQNPPAVTSSAVQSASPTDARAQIDDLIKQSNEQMNVKGQFQRAAEFAQQALDLSNKIGDKMRASTAMVYLGAAYAYQGRLAEAFEVSEKNVTLARETGDKKLLEQALNTAAGVAGESGRYEESLAYLYQCLDLARKINDRTMQYMSLLNIGEAYFRSGDPDRAEAPLRESLRIARELKQDDLKSSKPSKKATEMALLNLGGMEAERHRYSTALSYYERVHASRPESPLWVIAALEGMAEAHEHLGQPRQAVELLQQAIPLAEKAASGLQYARLVSDLGVNQEALQETDAALASQYRSLALVHGSGGNPDYEWQIESRIGHVLHTLQRDQDALEHYRKATAGIERLRSVALNTEEGRAGVLAKSRETYTEAADLLYDLHRENEALEMAERGRARAFLDMLAESRAGLMDELTPEQRESEQRILARVAAAEKSLWKENIGAEEKRKCEGELRSAEEDLEGFHLQVRHTNPRYAGVRYPEPITAPRIQSNLLDDKTAFVEYLLGGNRSLVWVLTKDDIRTAVLPARKEIDEQVIAYRKLMSQRVSALTVHQSLLEIDRVGAKLYDSIFRPIENVVRSSGSLIIVPDGSLSYLPFEALVTGSGHHGSRPSYLAEKFAIVYGPSASALVAVQEINREPMAFSKVLLAFGDPILRSDISKARAASSHALRVSASHVHQIPPAEEYAERGFSLDRLPYTRNEVLAIGKLVPLSRRELYFGAQATEDAVKNAKLDDFRFIHFATHGFLDEANPNRSGILLSREPTSAEDGILQTNEIMRLKMNAGLVTLSACGTGLGKLVNGEGILGLTRSFFYAGARNVAVSLWNVNDSATATLMESFYRNMNRGLPKSEALRQAKLTFLHSSQLSWRHPYYWAAFVIEGEGH
jgi:CHAT domain-containing protein